MSASSFFADAEAPIALLTAKKHFEQLPSSKEKLYAHHLSRASFFGTRAILRSISPESETIYDLILAIYSHLGSPATNDAYVAALADRTPQLTAQVVTKYLEYASAFLSNLGNYKSFGDKKFIPALSVEEFDQVIESVGSAQCTVLYKQVRSAIFDVSRAQLLGWPEKGHLSNYYPDSLDITKAEVDTVNAALAAHGVMPENTRITKRSSTEFVVLVASANTTNTTGYYPDAISENGISIAFQFGDHSKEFAHIVMHLQEATKYVANDTQHELLTKYIEAFETGSMNAHKASQIAWVKDLNPLVESNIGFIETYREPAGVRGEWEGMVAMVNQEQTAKFGRLVAAAETLIPYLPWDALYEKDKFTPPDFTSLEVLSFATSGLPAGINIPNYDDVRLNYGFKNVSLGNVMLANPKNPRKEEVVTFIEKSLGDKFKKYRDEAFEVQVGLHELLGHGTGKLLQEVSEGVFNFDREAHPEIKTYYKSTETWGSLFGSISGSFEECRAELVALYLILKHPGEVLPIFDIKDKQQQDDIVLIATVLMCRAGLIALEFWDPQSRKWGQAHMQGRFGIFQTLLESGACTLVEGDAANYEDLQLTFDEAKFGKAAELLGEFLHNIQIYKCTADFANGEKYYLSKTNVSDYFAQFRDAVIKKKLPRKQLVQANTFVQGEDVEVREYDESEAGMIQSYAERAV
ncbi:Dipeptidyl peptidase 3 [[Candida] zeylanoides]